jgi:formylglycine-generating enzyme required for sulfatase activity
MSQMLILRKASVKKSWHVLNLAQVQIKLVFLMRNWLVFIFAFVCLLQGFVNFGWSEQAAIEKGTLIVVYQTGPKGDRLDRVRFWLRDATHSQTMYPKSNAFVDDFKNMTRTVVVEDLQAGEYTLEFLIPNKDATYDDPVERSVTIKPGEVTKIDQDFKIREINYYDAVTLQDWTAWLLFIDNVTDVAYGFPGRPLPPRDIGFLAGSLNVESNLQSGEWVLFRGDTVTYHGEGSISNLMVPPGRDYLIRAKPVEGYQLKVYPPGRFSIGRRQSFVARITYERTKGFIQILANAPRDEAISVDILPENRSVAPIHLDLQPLNGQVQWSSEAIPTGNYAIVFQMPQEKAPRPPILVTLHEDEHLQINPDLNLQRDLTVESNTENAIYLLQQSGSEKKWQGQGMKFTFNGVPPGDYTLNFSSTNPDYLIPPEPKKIMMGERPQEVQAAFQMAGKLIVETNAAKAHVTLIAESLPTPTIKEEISGGRKSFQLLPGDYQVIVETMDYSKQKSQEIHLKGFETQTVKAYFLEGAQANRQEKSQIVVISNIMEAKFKVQDTKDKNQKPKVYQGKYVSITLDPNSSYELIFDPAENYTAPKAVSLDLKPGEHRIIRADYIPSQKLVVVPEGKVFLGDTFGEGAEDELPMQIAAISQFSIGIYEVTNVLYANWLTKVVKEGKLIYLSDFDKKGQVIDLDGHLICKTIENDSNSQISASQDSELGTVFRAIPGKDNHPMINVTWYGAQAYCSDNNYRLPTEAEWEKAAGMSIEKEGQSLKKYRYGFSQDTIDRTWANYKYNDLPITNFQVLTTEIGFYNGVNLLPLSVDDKTQLRTHDAKSPVGAYDMSGNVFEWIADWYQQRQSTKEILKDPKGPPSGKKKIAKGGCYASLAEELRVSKRLPLPPEHCDPYTGFRIAK